MRTLIAVVAALVVSGCAAVQAEADGKRYTCIPNSAMDRGPFQPEPAAGTAMVVSGTSEAVAQK